MHLCTCASAPPSASGAQERL